LEVEVVIQVENLDQSRVEILRDERLQDADALRRGSPERGLPTYGDIPVDTVSWMQEIRARLLEIWKAATEPTPESAVFITNLPYYYGDNENPSPAGMGSFFPSINPRVPILGDPTIADIVYCLQTYDTVPRQI
jgi:hypothetical protein